MFPLKGLMQGSYRFFLYFTFYYTIFMNIQIPVSILLKHHQFCLECQKQLEDRFEQELEDAKKAFMSDGVNIWNLMPYVYSKYVETEVIDGKWTLILNYDFDVMV